MNAREQAQQISQAIVETQHKLHTLEHDTNWYPSKRDQITRLKRVIRALDRDLDKIVATIPQPVQFSLWDAIAPPASAPTGLGQEPFGQEDRQDLHPSQESVTGNSTPRHEGR